MEKAIRRRYTLEYKQESVRLVSSGQKVAAAAETLGIVEQTLANWVKAEKAGQLRRVKSEQVSAKRMQVNRLRAELYKSQGNCWDNACSETLFGSLKVEWLHGMEFTSHRDAQYATFEWLLWYNGSRMHSTLRDLSPAQFEQQAVAHQMARAA